MAEVSVLESTTRKFRCESGGSVTCFIERQYADKVFCIAGQEVRGGCGLGCLRRCPRGEDR